MSISFTGDFKKLKRWEDKLKRTPQLLPIISKNLAEETVSLIQEGMSVGEDPYGKQYEPLALRSGRPLLDSGGMKSSWHRTHSKSGFRVANAKKYSSFHQKGTGLFGPKRRRIVPTKANALRVPTSGGPVFFSSVRGIPKRRMVPDKGLPRSWARAYREVASEIFSSHFR